MNNNMTQTENGRRPTTSRTRRGLRSQVEEERQAAVEVHAATIEPLSREKLADENRRLGEEVERLRNVEEQLLRENAKIREDRRNIKREKRNQKAQLDSAEAEVQRLQERYRVTTEEKVALAEELAVSNVDCAGSTC